MDKDKIQIIKNKIDLIETKSNQKCIFNKTAKEKDILKFECKFELKLPQDYRDFILEIGNGGFMNLEFLNLNHYIHRIDKNNRISKKFPLKKALIEFDEDLDEHINIGNYDFVDSEKLKYDFNDLYNGQILLKSTGCGNYLFLVVNGEEYGNVWIWEYPSNGEILPYNGNSWENRLKSIERKTFSDWMLQELNNYLNK